MSLFMSLFLYLFLCLFWAFLVAYVGSKEQESLYKIFLASMLGSFAITLLFL